jgi:hypothetical protein
MQSYLAPGNTGPSILCFRHTGVRRPPNVGEVEGRKRPHQHILGASFMPFRRFAGLAIWLTAAMPIGAVAQAPAASGHPAMSAAQIEARQAPTIDADLSDPAWADATVIETFRQKEPVPGAAPTERTVLKILYDENNLYFGVYAYDSSPDRIVSRAMARDGELSTGDTITVTLDPGLTRRNAYAFSVSPSGGRADALFLNNTGELKEWDPIWIARARRVADGWIAEMAIPFQSLSYNDDLGRWGFEFSRRIARKNEEIRWSSTVPALEPYDVSEVGTLTGIANVHQGIGLDVQIYGALRAKHDWRSTAKHTGFGATAGGNAFYKITPALTGTLTVNPDFSDAPLDVRQVNTSRFDLFFPETRDFFLQDAGAFEFGGINFADKDDDDVNNGRPFFSRNIGLVDDVPVSILGGGKISGEYAGFGIGGLSVYTDRTRTASRQLLSAFRITRPVFEQSRLGFVFTNGDPTGQSENTVAGADFQYRRSDLFGGKTLRADFFYQRSFSDIAGDDDSFGAALAFPNEPWAGTFTFKEIGADFFPALGFVNRTAIRAYTASADYTYRVENPFLKIVKFGTYDKFVTDLSNRPETRFNEAFVGLESQAADSIGIAVHNQFEAVPAAFAIGDIIVPRGRYEWDSFEIWFESADARPLAVYTEVNCCGFYNGRALEVSFGVGFRPNEFFEIIPNYKGNFIDLPTGSVAIHVAELTSAINFTPDMQLALQAQYDNISREFGFLARFRWEYLPGSEFFAALGQSAFATDSGFAAQRTQLSLRLGHTLRF